MLEGLEQNIISKNFFTKQSKLLVALSGGVDSVVLAYLLKKLGYNFELAHMNFKLRGKESDDDEKFCIAFAKKLGVKIHVKNVNLKAKRNEMHGSVQMAARALRYEWFFDLLDTNKMDCIVTAHNASENTETVLLNLIRGTGISGLTGIPEKNALITRPFLIFTKTSILDYSKKNKIKFREDSSNAEDKYKRNFLRLNVIPLLKKLNPSIDETFAKNIEIFEETETILEEYESEKYSKLITQDGKQKIVNRDALMKERHPLIVTKAILRNFLFNNTQVKNLIAALESEHSVRKKLMNDKYILTVHANTLNIIERDKDEFEPTVYNSYFELKCDTRFKISERQTFKIPNNNQIYLHKKDLVYPLCLRKPFEGDKFNPFGMKGFKLMSDFIREQKLDDWQKKQIRILINGNNEIIWVIGYRSDERYRVNEKSKELLKIEWLGN